MGERIIPPRHIYGVPLLPVSRMIEERAPERRAFRSSYPIDTKGCCGHSEHDANGPSSMALLIRVIAHEAGGSAAAGACSYRQVEGRGCPSKHIITVNDHGDHRPNLLPPTIPSFPILPTIEGTCFFLRLCPIAATTLRAMTTPFYLLCLVQLGQRNRYVELPPLCFFFLPSLKRLI